MEARDTAEHPLGFSTAPPNNKESPSPEDESVGVWKPWPTGCIPLSFVGELFIEAIRLGAGPVAAGSGVLLCAGHWCNLPSPWSQINLAVDFPVSFSKWTLCADQPQRQGTATGNAATRPQGERRGALGPDSALAAPSGHPV